VRYDRLAELRLVSLHSPRMKLSEYIALSS